MFIQNPDTLTQNQIIDWLAKVFTGVAAGGAAATLALWLSAKRKQKEQMNMPPPSKIQLPSEPPDVVLTVGETSTHKQ